MNRLNRKFLAAAFCLMPLIGAGCSSSSQTSADTSGNTGNIAQIDLMTREEGSGTRSAFIELFGIEEKDAEGNKVDNTTTNAGVTNSTAVMLTTVGDDPNALGYVSMGSLNDTVKTVSIDGVAPSTETIKDQTYKAQRPFILAIRENDTTPEAEDFISYVLSDDGQKVVAEEGYIPLDNTSAYTASDAKGKVVIHGSSSVTPVMMKLKEAYASANPNVEVEIQQSDSSTGLKDEIAGTCDIAMSSRGLKDSETSEGLKPIVMAMDGIAVIVSPDNSTENLTADQVKEIYTGKITTWDEVK